MDLSAFYGAFSPACFALLGLWLVAVQVRLPVWEKDPERRRRSYGVALHFALPGRSGTLATFRARRTLTGRQHGSSQERGSRRCDEKFVFHDYDPPDFCPCRRASALGKRWSASLVPSMR